MKKHPSNFKVLGHLVALVESVREDPVTLYEGIVLAVALKPICCRPAYSSKCCSPVAATSCNIVLQLLHTAWCWQNWAA